MSSFLTNHGVVVALVCAGCAVMYGLLTTRALLALSPGSERVVSRPYITAQPAQTRATTTPWFVRKLLKKNPPRSD